METKIDISFSEYLGDLLDDRNISRKTLAERIPVSESTVQKWCLGTRWPNDAFLPTLAEALNLSAAERSQLENSLQVTRLAHEVNRAYEKAGLEQYGSKRMRLKEAKVHKGEKSPANEVIQKREAQVIPEERAQALEEQLPAYLRALAQDSERINRLGEDKFGSHHITEIVQLAALEPTGTAGVKADIQTVPLSDIVEEHARLLIIGDPGAGKSTFLRWVAHTYAKEFLGSDRSLPMPVLLRLKWYKRNSSGNGLLKLAVSCLEGYGIECDERAVNSWFRKGHFIFLLDAYDEIDDPNACIKDLEQLMGLSSNNRFVLTSRETEPVDGLQKLGFQRRTVESLSYSQITSILDSYLEETRAGRLLEELENHDLLDEASNPLWLWFMILEFDESKPFNKGQLFKRVVENRFLRSWDIEVIPSGESIRKHVELKISVLSRIAYRMVSDGNSLKLDYATTLVIIDDYLVHDGRANPGDLRDELLSQILRHHILERLGSNISFWHKSFRDYFAALELSEILAKESKGFAEQYANKKWEGSLVFLAGLLDDPLVLMNSLLVQPSCNPFVQFFSRLFPLLEYHSEDRVLTRLILAARCLGANREIDKETEMRVGQLLVTRMGRGKWMNWRAVNALGETKSQGAIAPLKRLIDSEEYQLKCAEGYTERDLKSFGPGHPSYSFLKQEAFKALAKLPDVPEELWMRAALSDDDPIVERKAEYMLRRKMTEETALKLVELLLDHCQGDNVRRRAVEILYGVHKSIGFDLEPEITDQRDSLKYPTITIRPLVDIALEDECDEVRSRAMDALHRYREEDKEAKIIMPFFDALRTHSDTTVRSNAVVALGNLRVAQARKPLSYALCDPDAGVRLKAAHWIRLLSHPGTVEEESEVARKLLQLFDDLEIDVRVVAISAYSSMRKHPTHEELSRLIELLRDDDLTVRSEAAKALGFFRFGDALDELHRVVEEDEYVSPWAHAIWAIVQIEPGFAEVVKQNGWERHYIFQLQEITRTLFEDLRRNGWVRWTRFFGQVAK